jgi:ribonuclease T2
MPGSMSQLEFHEWFKHGTCYGKGEDPYFDDALLLMQKLNDSSLDEFFVAHIGKSVSNADVRAAVDAAFGAGTGDHVGIGCTEERDGERVILTELRIQMKGAVTASADLGDLIRAGEIATEDSCRNDMVIDAVGL